MLTQNQITAFRMATAAHNLGHHEEDATLDEALCNEDEVVHTRDTAAAFIASHGRPDQCENYKSGDLLVWNKVQTRKGARRGDLYVMDFGDVRAAYFLARADRPRS